MGLHQVLYHSTPFQTTIGSDEPRPEGHRPTLGIEMAMTNHPEGAHRSGEKIRCQVPGTDG